MYQTSQESPTSISGGGSKWKGKVKQKRNRRGLKKTKLTDKIIRKAMAYHFIKKI
jgi:hypothetical protein